MGTISYHSADTKFLVKHHVLWLTICEYQGIKKRYGLKILQYQERTAFQVKCRISSPTYY